MSRNANTLSMFHLKFKQRMNFSFCRHLHEHFQRAPLPSSIPSPLSPFPSLSFPCPPPLSVFPMDCLPIDSYCICTSLFMIPPPPLLSYFFLPYLRRSVRPFLVVVLEHPT